MLKKSFSLLLIKYLSKRAVILYHPIPNSPAADNVILDLSWLTDVLQKIVTVTPQKAVPRNLWKDVRRAQREGIVTDGLLKFYLKDVEKQDVIIDVMKYFNLLCDRHDFGCPADERDYINIEGPLEDPLLSSSDENVTSYFVPCLLREECELESLGVTDESALRPLQLCSKVRIPLPLFYRILTVFSRRFSRKPTLHRNLAYFNVHSGHRLKIVYLSHSLQFTVLKSAPEPIKRDVCCAVRQYVVDRIKKAREPGMRGLVLELRCDGVTIPERYRCPGGTEDLYDVHGEQWEPPRGLDLWYAEKHHEAASATASLADEWHHVVQPEIVFLKDNFVYSARLRDILMAKSLLSPDDIEEIGLIKTTRERVHDLIWKYLSKRGPGSLLKFIEALEEDYPPQSALAQRLRSRLSECTTTS